MKILVTGSMGQLGSEFQQLNTSSPYEFLFTDLSELDITDLRKLRNYFQSNSIDTIINCAAYTAVDKAENEKEKADLINIKGVENLVLVCREYNIKLVHFSTDYVFDGKSVKPYKETDQVNPQGVYGLSKLNGEYEIMNSGISALIIRTSWLYSAYGNNFVKTMLSIGETKKSLNIVYDQIGSPTNAKDLAKATLKCIEQSEMWLNQTKIYHYSNEGVTSWFDFAKMIFEYKQIRCEVKPILSEDYPTQAYRPGYSVLDKCKIKTDFDLKIAHWTSSLQRLIAEGL